MIVTPGLGQEWSRRKGLTAGAAGVWVASQSRTVSLIATSPAGAAKGGSCPARSEPSAR
jgi:hypothetical protein